MRSKRVRGYVGIVIGICATVLCCCSTNSIKDIDSIMKINNQPVVKAEYQMMLSKYSAEVKRNYTTKEVNEKGFWTKETKEGTPIMQLIELANEDLITKKVIAALANETGTGNEPDYLSIQKQCEDEKEGGTRESAKSSYGLSSYSAEDYYEYIYQGLQAKVVEALKNKQELSEKELLEYYEIHKKEYTSDIAVTMIIGEMRTELGEEVANKAGKTLAKQTDISQLSKKYPDINFYQMTMSSLNTEEGKTGAYTLRWNIASSMHAGEVCSPFQIGDHFVIMKCQKREEQVAEPFEDVKGILKSKLLTDRANEIMEDAKKNAIVTFDKKIVRQVALETVE